MLIDFELTTGATVRTMEGSQRDSSALLRREPPVKSLVKLFQFEVLKVVEVLFTKDVMRIFRPSKSGLARLGGLAARGGYACVSGWPCWGEARHAGPTEFYRAKE